MIQAYDYYNHNYDKAPNEVDEYCRLEGVTPLLMRRSIAEKEKAESERRLDVLISMIHAKFVKPSRKRATNY